MRGAMPSSRVIKAAVAALLVISLWLKLALLREPPPPDPLADARFAATILRESGFNARAVSLPRSPGAVTIGERNGCRLLAGPADAAESLAAVYAELARPIGPVHYVEGGRLVAVEPRVRTTFAYYWRRELHRIGVASDARPLFAVAISPGCAGQYIDWLRFER